MASTQNLVTIQWSLLSFVALTLAGCAVPEHMEVRTDIDPANEDKQVRFRSTHFYRVVDLCNDSPIHVHALYRFRMSGKSGALGNTVNFESGTLKSHQIDPFGADISFDSTSRQFTYTASKVPTPEVESCQTNITNNKAMMAHLLAACQPRSDGATKQDKTSSDFDLLTDCLKKPLDDRIKTNIQKVVDGMATCATSDSNPNSDNDEELCPDGKQSARGFQVFGPEGWRTFNQNDRLILAMYSDGQPLISTLKTISQAVLDGKNSSDIPKNTVLKEKLRLSDAKLQVKEMQESTTNTVSDESWTNLLLTFSPPDEQTP